jgi:hypothetical protein
MGAMTGLKMKLKLLKIPKNETTDEAFVVRASASDVAMCSGKHLYHTNFPGVHAQ